MSSTATSSSRAGTTGVVVEVDDIEMWTRPYNPSENVKRRAAVPRAGVRPGLEETLLINQTVELCNEVQRKLLELNAMSKRRFDRQVTPYMSIEGDVRNVISSLKNVRMGKASHGGSGSGSLKEGYTRSGTHYYKIVHRQVPKAQACYK